MGEVVISEEIVKALNESFNKVYSKEDNNIPEVAMFFKGEENHKLVTQLQRRWCWKRSLEMG